MKSKPELTKDTTIQESDTSLFFYALVGIVSIVIPSLAIILLLYYR